MAWDDYKGRSIGLAKIMAEVPLSDGLVADEILNFTLDERGYLDSTFEIMPLIPNEWRGSQPPYDFAQGIVGLGFGQFEGGVPRLLLLGKENVREFVPGQRANATSNPGMIRQTYFKSNNVQSSVAPQAELLFPPQTIQVGNRMYFTYGDGASAWVWDGSRVRPFGFPQRPSSIEVDGPQRDKSSNANSGGFSVRGRIGTTDSTWTAKVSSDIISVGGIDAGLWKYRVVFEGPDGSLSESSPDGGAATIRMRTATTIGEYETFLRKFRVKNIPIGPPETAARILLRTANLDRLPPGDFGEYHYLHRIPNNLATEWIDDIPDGELGSAWEERGTTPIGIYILQFFGGSMFMLRTDGNPSRVWWSEQTGLNGPITESALKGHWRDVFPDTGAITGALPTRFSDASQGAVMLIFKEGATHFVAGNYPDWQFGTLHSRAGCAGPSLAQAIPDGSTIWYGSRTFWRLSPDGKIEDIGEALRKRLRRVNHVRAQKGISWIDRRAGEAVFVLPIDDGIEPSLQFVYDYRLSGWRLRDDMSEINAAVTLGGTDMTLVSGVHNGIRNVYVRNRGYSNYATGAVTSRYRTGWLTFAEIGPNMHGSYRSAELVFTLEERNENRATVRTRADWNLDGVVNTESITEVAPEDDGIAFFGSGTTAASYSTGLYRTMRPYTHRLAIDVPHETVFQVEVETTTDLAIYNVDAYGPQLSTPAGRVAGGSDT